MAKIKFTDEEQKHLEKIKSLIASTESPGLGYSADELTREATEILNSAIEAAEKKGMRGVKNLVDSALNDEEYMKKRLDAGLTEKDISEYYDRDGTWIFIDLFFESKNKIAMYNILTDLLTSEGKEGKEAALILRKTHLYTGDPNEDLEGYQPEDGNIYPEFKARVERWRIKVSPEKEHEMAQRYTSYNAMVRDLIKKGKL